MALQTRVTARVTSRSPGLGALPAAAAQARRAAKPLPAAGLARPGRLAPGEQPLRGPPAASAHRRSAVAAAAAAPAVPLPQLAAQLASALMGGHGEASGLERLSCYWLMSRPWNILPSLLLVLVGAWAGAGHAVCALRSTTVWLVGAASATIAVASCVINDYFDYITGVDAADPATYKPLPAGAVPADGALLFASCLYISLLAGACLLSSFGVRLILAASSLATLVYTPVLKRIPVVKNLLVAATVAAAPLAGALAAGTGAAGLQALLLPSAYLFLGITCRELLMDINDAASDAAAGVRTVPVLLGPQAALRIAAGLAAAAGALSLWGALRGGSTFGAGSLAWAGGALAAPEHWAAYLRSAAAVAATWNAAGLAAAVAGVWRGGCSRESVDAAVQASMERVGMGALLLMALC